MAKYKYITEYEVKVSAKMLYMYVADSNKLEDWFAEKVNKISDEKYGIIWGGHNHLTKVISKRNNHHIKFKFLNTETDTEGCNTLEFRINFNEMTQTSFLKIIDYSEMNDEEGLRILWDSLIKNLREAIKT